MCTQLYPYISHVNKRTGLKDGRSKKQIMNVLFMKILPEAETTSVLVVRCDESRRGAEDGDCQEPSGAEYSAGAAKNQDATLMSQKH